MAQATSHAPATARPPRVCTLVPFIMIVTVLYTYRNLVSLDLWRCRFLSRDSIDTIASNCKNLEEIDIGWWYVCIINPQHACAARVTVLGLCVCLSVCLSVYDYSLTTGYEAAYGQYQQLQCYKGIKNSVAILLNRLRSRDIA